MAHVKKGTKVKVYYTNVKEEEISTYLFATQPAKGACILKPNESCQWY